MTVSIPRPQRPVPPLRINNTIVLVYCLSQEAQREAWLAGRCAEQIQKKRVTKRDCSDLEWEMLLEWMWISSWGEAVIFIGGSVAFTETDHKEWRRSTETHVPGRWEVTYMRASHPLMAPNYCVQQQNDKVQVIEDYDITIRELIEMEENRRDEIVQSRASAEQECAKKQHEADERIKKMFELDAARIDGWANALARRGEEI